MHAANVGKTISKLRKKLGLTQLELANKLNVSDKTVSKWENGGGFPEISLLPAISEVFGISIDYLLKGDTQGIAIAGTILIDIVNILDLYPEKNMLANVLKTTYAVGGCVANTIIDLAKIDSDIFLTAIAKVGNDENGRYITSEIKKYGVDVSKIKISTDIATSSSNVMTDSRTGERTFFYTSGANSDFDISDIDIDQLDCKIFHAGYILLLDKLDAKDEEYGTKMARLLAMVSAKGIKTSIDVVSDSGDRYAEKIIPVLKYCDYIIINEIEACNITHLPPRNDDGSLNIDNIRITMEKLIDYGVREKVIVHCPQAGFMMTATKQFIVVPSLSLPEDYIKSTVGAGDAYAAACLYGIYKNYDNVKTLEFAAAAAACNLSSEDAVSGMKSKAEIEKLNTKYKRREI